MNREPLQHKPALWDAAIAALIVLPVAGAWWLLSSADSPVASAAAGVLLLGSAMVAYGSFIESRRIVVNKKVVRNSSLPVMTIAVLGDFHVGPYKQAAFVRRAVEKTNALKPDLILLVGDFVYDHHADIAALKPLGDLRAPGGVFAVMGNHDSGHHLHFHGARYRMPDRTGDITILLESMGITVLRDSVTPADGGFNILIAGVDAPWHDMMNLDAVFGNITGLAQSLPVILLAHNPDVILVNGHEDAALIVSGHTHGGQIRLPLVGSLARIPDELGRSYDQGIFPLKNGSTLAITHGLGETMARARLFCPPEILLLEVQSKTSS